MQVILPASQRHPLISHLPDDARHVLEEPCGGQHMAAGDDVMPSSPSQPTSVWEVAAVNEPLWLLIRRVSSMVVRLLSPLSSGSMRLKHHIQNSSLRTDFKLL